MKPHRSLRLLVGVVLALSLGGVGRADSRTSPSTQPVEIQIPNGSLPIRVLVQSPAETVTELQVICLFRSSPSNTLHGSLLEANAKLKGLLDQVRNAELFRGELGETLLIVPPVGSLKARKLLIIGLGDSETFTPLRMELVGSILYREANRLRTAHPFFAPTILDGGVTKYPTGQVSEQVLAGFLRAARTERQLAEAGAAQGQAIKDLTFLAGAAHVSDTRQGIEKAMAAHAAK